MNKRLFFLLNVAQKKLFKHVDKVCEQTLDASVTQLAALMYIEKQPGCSQKDLAKILDLNKSAITGLVTRMEKNALLDRLVSQEDARAIKLWPTEAGLEKVKKLKPLIDQLNNALKEDFTEEEIETVLKFLNYILIKF